MALSLTLEEIALRFAVRKGSSFELIEAAYKDASPEYQELLSKYGKLMEDSDFEKFVSEYMNRCMMTFLRIAFQED